MKQHATEWPTDSMTEVQILEFCGAWFVSFIGEAGARLPIRKRNGRRKGFRSLDALVPILRSVYGVKTFAVTLDVRPFSLKR